MNSKKLTRISILIPLLVVVILSYMAALTKAQPVAAPAGATIQSTLQLEISPPQVRTWQEMEAATALEAAGPPQPPRVKPFRPTMAEAAYQALKAQTAQAPARQAPVAPAVPQTQAPLTTTINFDGVQYGTAPGQAGILIPPDTHGAVGPNHFVEITNSHIDVYQKAAPNTRVNGNGNGVSLSAFFNYHTQGLFDVRVIYDPVAQRWIVSSDAFAESAAVQKFFFAVSQTADPTGTYFFYNVNVSDGQGSTGGLEWDFPQLGMDQNAIIFTANFYHGIAYVDTRMFAVPKSQIYNGQTLTPAPHVFTGLVGTLAPPIVLDTNPNTYLLAADNVDNKVSLYTLTNSAGALPTLNGPVSIPVTAYTAPPAAPQPGTANTIDTSDARFINASTQIGNSLFQVHSIASGTYARCRFYEFDTVTKQVIQSGDFGRSATSYDFNASIAANRYKDIFVTWSATDPTNNVNAEMRFSGRLRTDPINVIPSPGYLLYGSTTFLGASVGQQRWGDYSAVSLDPADPSGATAWIVNEKIVNTSTWGSRIGSISLPRPSGLPAVYLLLLGN